MVINWQIKSIDFYIEKLRRGDRFAFAGYSDAEMFCMINHHCGHPTSLGQILDRDVGQKLLNIIIRRHTDERFMFAVPDCMWKIADFTDANINLKIESLLESSGIDEITFYERDMVTDDLARDAGLFPFIQEIRNQRTVLIGNKFLRDVYFFPHEHVETSMPNQHLDPEGIENVIRECVKIGKRTSLFLVSAGISAALIIDRLYDLFPNASFFDCGSMWDAFCGIGCQREWRRRLYMDPVKLAAWRKKCLNGVK